MYQALGLDKGYAQMNEERVLLWETNSQITISMTRVMLHVKEGISLIVVGKPETSTEETIFKLSLER